MSERTPDQIIANVIDDARSHLLTSYYERTGREGPRKTPEFLKVFASDADCGLSACGVLMNYGHLTIHYRSEEPERGISVSQEIDIPEDMVRELLAVLLTGFGQSPPIEDDA